MVIFSSTSAFSSSLSLSSDETSSTSSTLDSLRRYSLTHFSTEVNLQATSSELISETEVHVSTSKSIYSSAALFHLEHFEVMHIIPEGAKHLHYS